MARKMEYTDRLGLGHIPTWTERWCLVAVVGVLLPEEEMNGCQAVKIIRCLVQTFSPSPEVSFAQPYPLPNLSLLLVLGSTS